LKKNLSSTNAQNSHKYKLHNQKSASENNSLARQVNNGRNYISNDYFYNRGGTPHSKKFSKNSKLPKKQSKNFFSPICKYYPIPSLADAQTKNAMMENDRYIEVWSPSFFC
jgi:hypothetical protein